MSSVDEQEEHYDFQKQLEKLTSGEDKVVIYSSEGELRYILTF
jgi:hypothetical protein